MKVRWKWVVLWSLWAARLVRQPTAERRARGGLLRGAVAADGSHAAYLGLRYATLQPDGRFKAPGPALTWDGIFEAIEENSRCIQRIGNSIVVGQEDCMTLNIFTPIDATSSSNLPVMVFIHGGGFYTGSNSRSVYGPQFLVKKGVILVTLNYRLNIQGFLCLRTEEAPGNAGMKDQVAGLRWVRDNIAAFGGDPRRVTLFGESAGAASVSFHLLSHMSAGLFHRAIIQSGSALSAWAYQYRPVYMASLLAKVMGYTTQDPNELYHIFKSKSDAELVVTRVPRKHGNTIISELLYAPCTEHVIDGVEPFLTDLPHKILSSGQYNKVPTMVGINSAEGLLFAALENDTMISNMEIEKSLPKDLIFPSDDARRDSAEKLKKMYLGDDDDISKSGMTKLARYYSELYFANSAVEETELLLQTNHKSVYNYIFSFDGWRNVLKMSLAKAFRKEPGATHADDLMYLFSTLFWPQFLETDMVEKVSTLWTNFAKYGDPTPAQDALLPLKWWPTNETMRAFVIDSTFSTIPFVQTDSLKYWRHLYAKHRRKGD